VRLSGAPLTGFELTAAAVLEGRRLEVRSVAGAGRTLLTPGRTMTRTCSQRCWCRAMTSASGSRPHVSWQGAGRCEARRQLNAWVIPTRSNKQLGREISERREVLQSEGRRLQRAYELYTALAVQRALPTRMAAGIVYMRRLLYYHAWPEVWLGEWTPSIPRFNSVPGDATHIRFVTGTGSRPRILKLVGN